MKAWWESLGRSSRLALATAFASVVVLLAGAGWWLLRPDPAVLFSDLRPQDAAALAAELDKLKVPYGVADNGATLLVERQQVHAVRLKLMGRDIPLHGAVGLELFNTTDFGMTEFAQKINFQRALQGELTRTILSLAEIREARVHLVLPEQGLFRQDKARAKAAVTLGLRPGHALRAEQVEGIQRLVAAAVPALGPQEVTVVDQQGVPLTRPADPGAEGVAGSTRLDLKRETEQYLARKATALLEQVFGPGQALASVDVTLNMDSVRVTTEDVIPAADGRGSAGVLVRERETARDGAPVDARNESRGARSSSMQRDAEYQAGRRVEQVVSQPGAIRRLQVVAVVREPLDNERQQRLERLLAGAVGATAERGDTVVVQALRAEAASAPREVPAPGVSAPDGHRWHELRPLLPLAAAALLVLAAAAVLMAGGRSRERAKVPLSQQQRRETLERVQTWLLESHATSAPAPERTGATR